MPKIPNLDLRGKVLESVSSWNIFPLTSTCNVRCGFCSHHQNPPGIESWQLPAISLDLAEEAIALINPEKSVVIGESVTRIMEGEPLVHPFFTIILQKIRNCFPNVEIKLTTNGNLLDQQMVDFLASLGGVVITLSINSACVRKRQYLMKDVRAATAVAAPALLKKAGIAYHGSIVAMPHWTGWDDLSDTLRFLDRQGASTVRVFLPGYTRFSPPESKLPQDFRFQLDQLIRRLRMQLEVPITVEPPLINHLDAVVAGVVKGSPASLKDIIAGDIVLSVNGDAAASRVDAFYKIARAENPVVEMNRQGEIFAIGLDKEAGFASGLVFDYDLDFSLIHKVAAVIKRKRAVKPLLLVSEMGYPVVKLGIEKFYNHRDIPLIPVKNRFFGGSIGCAGLLTVQDLLEAVRMHGPNADLVLVPGMAFDSRGRDITGTSYLELELEEGPQVEII